MFLCIIVSLCGSAPCSMPPAPGFSIHPYTIRSRGLFQRLFFGHCGIWNGGSGIFDCFSRSGYNLRQLTTENTNHAHNGPTRTQGGNATSCSLYGKVSRTEWQERHTSGLDGRIIVGRRISPVISETRRGPIARVFFAKHPQRPDALRGLHREAERQSQQN